MGSRSPSDLDRSNTHFESDQRLGQRGVRLLDERLEVALEPGTGLGSGLRGVALPAVYMARNGIRRRSMQEAEEMRYVRVS